MKSALKSLLNRPAVKGFAFPTLVACGVFAGLLAVVLIPVTVR